MRGKAFLISVGTAVVTVAIGCHHDKHDLAFTPKEECVLPPDQPRFNNPPSAAYQPRRPKVEEKTLVGRQGSMGSGGAMGGPGF
jgi:hypothetical protein